MRYEKDPRGLDGLLNSPEMLNLVESVASIGANIARGAAPEETGELKRRITSTGAERKGGIKKDRAEAFIESDADHTAAQEWGNKASGPGEHFLQTAIDAIDSGRR